MKQRIKSVTISIAILSLLTPTLVHSQGLNPSYLSEMPAPARVIAEIKGTDPANAGERQLAAFTILWTLIIDMAYGLEHRFERQLTPDEQRVTGAYQKAYADLWHKVKDTYGKEYMGDLNHDRDLRNEVLDKFFSASFKALYTKSNQQANKQLQAARDRAYGNTPADTGPTQPATQGGGPGSTKAMNRCVASGRTLRRCFTEELGNGFSQMAGGFFNINEPIPIPTGLRMTGDYASANGFRVIFEPEIVTMVCRGVPSKNLYSVEVTNTQALITIKNGPKPLVLSLSSDGKLTGSGPVRVAGQVPAGSHTEQTAGMTTQHTTRTKEITPLERRQYPDAAQNGQTYTVQEDSTELVYGPTGTRTVTDFVQKTADCTVGVLSPIGGSPMPTVNQMATNPIAYITTLFSGVGVMMKGGSKEDALNEMLSPKAEKAIAPGLRMHGSYGSPTGFSLAFHPETVTLGCGDSERALEYSVQRSGAKTILVAKENGTPIPFQLMPDGSVVGEGTVLVNGRVITGTREDINEPFIFAPHPARCEVGRLVPGAAPGNVAVTSNSTPPPAGSAPGVAAPGGATTLTIAAGPGVANLLANKILAVLKDSLESVLAQAGVSAQGRSSRVSAWTLACDTDRQGQICQTGVNAFRSYGVTSARLDANGSTTFANIPSTGTFYIVVDTSKPRHLFWNVRVDLKPGSNSVHLDERNITPVDR